jgi:hypothetical protein
MGRDDVPEQDVVAELELLERLLDDRRRGLRRAGSRELPLGGEGQAADAGTAVAGRLPGEEQGCVRVGVEIVG